METKKPASVSETASATPELKAAGTATVLGFSPVGSMSGLGTVTVEARETRSLDDPKSYASGILITVKGTGSYDRNSSSYVRYEEIEPLMRGIDAIAKVDKSITSFDNFQANYKTIGDFRISVYSTRGGAIESVAAAGATSVYLKLSDLSRLKALLADAKSKLDAAKTANK